MIINEGNLEIPWRLRSKPKMSLVWWISGNLLRITTRESSLWNIHTSVFTYCGYPGSVNLLHSRSSSWSSAPIWQGSWLYQNMQNLKKRLATIYGRTTSRTTRTNWSKRKSLTNCKYAMIRTPKSSSSTLSIGRTSSEPWLLDDFICVCDELFNVVEKFAFLFILCGLIF